MASEDINKMVRNTITPNPDKDCVAFAEQAMRISTPHSNLFRRTSCVQVISENGGRSKMKKRPKGRVISSQELLGDGRITTRPKAQTLVTNYKQSWLFDIPIVRNQLRACFRDLRKF